MFNYGKITVQPTYLKKNYMIEVNAFQASILCLYNQAKVYTVRELKERLQLADQDLE